MKLWLAGLVLVSVTSAVLTAQDLDLIPLGDQFQVNTYTTGFQNNARVAGYPGCPFVAAWESSGSFGDDSDNKSIQASLISPSGEVIGTQFQVNTYTTNRQQSANVAVAPDCSFVVVWFSPGSSGTDSDNRSVQGRRFAADTQPLTGQFQINTTTTGYQDGPEIDMAGDGSFVVVWHSSTSAGTDTDDSVQAQRFNSDASFLGSEFQVNTYTTGDQGSGAVAVSATGDFVVVWDSNGSPYNDNSAHSVQAQRFLSDGRLLGSQFQVNTYTNNTQGNSRVALNAQGKFVVVWTSYGSYGTDQDGGSVQGQLFNSVGSPIGGEFQVNTYTTDNSTLARVAAGADGEFLVTWESKGSFESDNEGRSIQARWYDADGRPSNIEFQVNTYTTNHQHRPSVATDKHGSFAVVWHSTGSFGTDNDHWSVQAQHYFAGFIFADGFESGDTSAWPSSVP